MRIPNFEVREQRSVRFAACDAVPRLMVIAGPNGSGKSTLLDALRETEGEGPILYVGPHRDSRRQQVRYRDLLGQDIRMDFALAQREVPNIEGIRVTNHGRSAWDPDETQSLLKYGLAQIEITRREAIAARFDRDGMIPEGVLPNPWTPLIELTSRLLPHLRFSRIDSDNRDQIRCLWTVHDSGVEVDLDDLSSGEKSIIRIFYPLVEQRIRAILREVRGQEPVVQESSAVVLIDEPELHLHPNLQAKVLDYLRVLSSSQIGGATQVIVATHSPTIVEAASFEELFLLRPRELVEADANQLIRIADAEERLEVLRALFGHTSNLTAMQPLVIVEGVRQDSRTRTLSDRKLYRALHGRFDEITVLPGGGKSECLALRNALAEVLPEFSPRLRAIALLDRDLALDLEIDDVVLLPVSMIENFLLDPDVIWEAIQAVVERSGFDSVDAVEAALDAVLDDERDGEVERRVLDALGLVRFRPSSPVDDIPVQLQEHVAILTEKYSTAAITAELDAAAEVVDQLGAERKRRESFHGKRVLDEFYGRHLSQSGLPKNIFKYEAARHARRRRAVTEFFDELFRGLLTDGA